MRALSEARTGTVWHFGKKADLRRLSDATVRSTVIISKLSDVERLGPG